MAPPIADRQSPLRHRRNFAIPYFLLFELLGPIIETLGYGLLAFELITRTLVPWLALAFFALAIVWGLVFSFGSLLIEEHAFRRYRRASDLARLALAALLENLGYRQLLTLIRARAFISMARGQQGWGELKRAPFTPPTPLEPHEPHEPHVAQPVSERVA